MFILPVGVKPGLSLQFTDVWEQIAEENICT
jgi:hypothetical protein